MRNPRVTAVTLSLLNAAISMSVGCRTADESMLSEVQAIREYFATVKPGTPVRMIELDLKLPSPVETESPAYGWPCWKYRYLTDKAMVYFYAEHKDNDDANQFVYVGHAFVQSRREYYEALGRLVSESYTPPSAGPK